jgi:hypothetical protein
MVPGRQDSSKPGSGRRSCVWAIGPYISMAVPSICSVLSVIIAVSGSPGSQRRSFKIKNTPKWVSTRESN